MILNKLLSSVKEHLSKFLRNIFCGSFVNVNSPREFEDRSLFTLDSKGGKTADSFLWRVFEKRTKKLTIYFLPGLGTNPESFLFTVELQRLLNGLQLFL
jgi:hypothetical protein